MPSCTVCKDTLPPEKDFVTCSSCYGGFHYSCANIGETSYRKMSRDRKAAWKCFLCKKNSGLGPLSAGPLALGVGVGNMPGASVEDNDVSSAALPPIGGGSIFGPVEIQILKQIVREQNADSSAALISDFQKHVEFLTDQLEDLKKTVREKDSKLDDCLARFDSLQIENAQLRDQNESLTTRIRHLEQYSRLSAVEIHGVPEPRNENVIATVASVARAVNFNLDVQMIDACHRLRSNPSKPDGHRGIILKFVSRLKKEEFLKARAVKRNVTTKDLDPAVTDSTPVYINESLSPENRKLFAQCRDFKKANNIRFLWVRNGQIKMRKEEKSRVFYIHSASCLNDVH